jgi:EAL domain-containing protein (putative c-di-GMP-specific phosphodiesterase class I)
VAEGVEERKQLRLLRSMGCDVIQGFLFSRPQPADKVRVLIEQATIEPGTDVL